jgi:hypothetical protein
MARIVRYSRTNWVAWIARVSGVVLLIGCTGGGVRVAPPTPPASPNSPANLADRSVCPQHGPVWIPAREDSAWRLVGSLSVPGTTTQIPEFHDCQRLLRPGGEGYGPTAAIYANPVIVSLIDTLLALANAGDSLRALAAAEIISDGQYQQLGIEIGVNCLYMYTTAGQLESFMRPVVMESDCLQRLNPVPHQPGWTPLHVRQEPESPPFMLADFPAAARWDYDDLPGPRQQFIGLPCKLAWCLIGHANAHSSKRFKRPPDPLHPPGNLSRRVVQIRGWYDEQILGVGGGSGPATPGMVFGTIFPDSLLEGRTDAEFEIADPPWVPAAEILVHGNLSKYKSKFNLDATPISTPGMPQEVSISNKVSLCKGDATRCFAQGGTAPTCTAPTDPTNWWYARIISVGREVRYYCVIRHLHPGFSIPGTARWWWLPNDEGIWMRCPQGCCQVK